MGFIPLRARSAALALVLFGNAAHAAERVNMPFDCAFAAGRVHLIPAQNEHSYAVLGPHERQVFSTCSPSDPQNCRSWLVHRFAIECEGGRVTWLEAAGSAARGENWDAWVEDGRFNMRMSRGWAVATVHRNPGRWGGWRGRFAGPGMSMEPFGRDDYRDDRVVTLPPGYAPAMGIPLSFSGGAPDSPVALAPDAQGNGWAAEPHSADAYAPPLGSTPRADTSPRAAQARVAAAPAGDVPPGDVPGAVAHAPLLSGAAGPPPTTVPDLPERAPRHAPAPAATEAPPKQAAVAPSQQPQAKVLEPAVPEPAIIEPTQPKPARIALADPEPGQPPATEHDSKPAGTSLTPRILNGPQHDAAHDSAKSSPPASPAVSVSPSTPTTSTSTSTARAAPDAITKTLAAADQTADDTSVSQAAPETAALPAAAATVEKHAVASGTAAVVLALLGLAAFGLWRRFAKGTRTGPLFRLIRHQRSGQKPMSMSVIDSITMSAPRPE